MAIYHLTSNYIGRGEGRSIIAAAAYRSASHLVGQFLDKETGLVVEREFNYENKPNVIFSEIFLPENAPAWMANRQDLWNHVELLEKRKDSRFAREVELALPKELDSEQNKELLRKYVKECFVDKGMVADVNIHWEEDNPHAHILLTTRSINGDQFGMKNPDWDTKGFILNLREMWANNVNQCFKEQGLDLRIDHRSYKDQGIDLVATVHEGVATRVDTHTDRVQLNKEIREENAKRVIQNPEIIIDLVASRYNIFSKAEIATEIFNVLENSQNFTDTKYFEEVLSKVLSHSRLQVVTELSVNKETLYTTLERDKVEKTLWSNVVTLQNNKSHKVKINDLSEALSQKQKDAAMHLTKSEGISLLVGRAGTGKSFLMREVTSIYERNGYKVIGGAVSGIATNGLAESCKTETGAFRTLAGWNLFLQGSDNQEYLNSKTVFIIDEASMAEMNDLSYLADKINAVGGKLILIGDPDQLQAIGIRGVFKALINKVGAFELDQIWRQKEEWQRDATLKIAKGEVREALLSYQREGCVMFYETKLQAKNNLIKSYVDEFIGGNKESIILAYTRNTVSSLNNEIRNHLIQAGELVEVNGAKYKTNEGIMSIACGEQVVFTKNNVSLGIYNGTRAIVEKVSSANSKLQGEITFKIVGDNRKITIDTAQYNNFAYGYATTIHKSQGLNIKDTYLLVEEYMSHNSLYVAASRHISNLHIFADKETFKDLDELGRIFERSYKDKGLIDDYNVTGERQEYFDRVRLYRGIRQEAADKYCEIVEHIKKNNLLFSDHPEYQDFLNYVATRKELATEIYEDLEKHSVFLTQAGISKSIVAKHAEVEAIELDNEDKTLREKEYQKLLASKDNVVLGEYSVQSIYRFYTEGRSIEQEVDKTPILREQRLSDFENDSNIDSRNLDSRWKATMQDAIKEYGEDTYVSWFSKMEMGEEKDGVLKIKTSSGFIKEYLETHYERKILRLAEKHFEGLKKLSFEISDELKSKHIVFEKETEQTNQSYVEQEAAFAISQNRYLFREKELNAIDDRLEKDAENFRNNALNKSLESGEISNVEKYVHLRELKGNEKTLLAKELNNKLDDLLPQKRALEVELKETRLEVLNAKERVSVADYKEDLLLNYLDKTYSASEFALDKWQSLKEELGQEGALLNIKEDFRILGTPRGNKFFGILNDRERKQALRLGKTLANKFLSHEEAQEKKQQAEELLDKHTKENTIENLENNISKIKQELSWLPENCRVMNEIKNEATKEITKDVSKELTKDIGEEKAKLIEVDYHALNTSIGKTLDKVSELKNQIEKTEHENKELKLTFSSVYRTEDADIIYRWNKLVREEGLDKAEALLNNNREYLGKLRGESDLFGMFKSKERKLALELSHFIGSDLRRHTENIDKIDKFKSAIETTKDKEINIALNKDMTPLQVQEKIFESEYKRIAFEQEKSPNLDQLKEISNIAHCAEKYALKFKDDLNKYTAKSIVETVKFELEREEVALWKSATCETVKELLDLHIMAKQSAKVQAEIYLTNKNIEGWEAIKMGKEKYTQIQEQVTQVMQSVSQEKDHLNFMIRNNVTDHIIQHSRTPDANELNKIIEISERDHTKAMELSNNLDKIIDSKNLDKSFTQEHKLAIAEFAVFEKSRDSHKQFSESIKSITQEVKELIKTQEQDKHRSMDLELTR